MGRNWLGLEVFKRGTREEIAPQKLTFLIFVILLLREWEGKNGKKKKRKKKTTQQKCHLISRQYVYESGITGHLTWLPFL